MKVPKYIRKSNRISTLKGATVEVYKSINKAKRESHKLQLSLDHALGHGSVVVSK